MKTITTPDWVREAVFYQIFPDRFAQSAGIPRAGLPLEDWDSPPTLYGFKGGDLLGIAERLDYLVDLGINALYLNPVFASASNHRYHTFDYYQVDPLLGGNQALRVLLDRAHERGIRVILDGVFNHASRGFWQFHHVLENGAGSPYVDWFHFDPERLERRKQWGAYPGPVEQKLLKDRVDSLSAIGYQAWYNLPALPKFNTDTPAVREFLWDVATHWLEFGIDGWRLDVPAEIDDDAFWQEFRRRVKSTNPEAYLVGEIWFEAQRWLQGDQFDAVMNYPLTGALIGFLIGERIDKQVISVGEYSRYLKPLDATRFGERIEYLLGLYEEEISLVQFNLLDSHDTPRFLTTARGDLSALKLALFFLFTFVGAPCIYYGDEIGLTGANDPHCRKSFPWNEQHWDRELLAYTRDLIALRKANPALQRGSYRQVLAEGHSFIFERALGSQSLIVALNASTNSVTVEFTPSLQSSQASLWGTPEITNQDSGRVRLSLSPRSSAVFQAG